MIESCVRFSGMYFNWDVDDPFGNVSSEWLVSICDYLGILLTCHRLYNKTSNGEANHCNNTQVSGGGGLL